SLHGKVVRQYQHHYREASPVSGDKECLYWIRFLPYHMAKANMSQVFKSTSGEKLTEIQAHDDEVLCCAFSPDDHLIATCSSDRKVKVWNIQQGKLLRVFEDEHEEQVNHCEFTNTARRLLLATCSNDTCLNVKIWNLNKPSSQNTMFGHFKPVNHCCFSPDDSYLSTSSNDGTVKVSAANEWKTIDVKTFFSESDDEEVLVKCSTWTADGTRIICAARNAALVRINAGK
ncbi:hypothetical protein GOODEAATRI_003820, partial [Goodea atripinnis]